MIVKSLLTLEKERDDYIFQWFYCNLNRFMTDQLLPYIGSLPALRNFPKECAFNGQLVHIITKAPLPKKFFGLPPEKARKRQTFPNYLSWVIKPRTPLVITITYSQASEIFRCVSTVPALTRHAEIKKNVLSPFQKQIIKISI